VEEKDSEKLDIEYLYRGVNVKLHNELNGELRPKKIGKDFSSIVQFGEKHAVFGNGIQFGDSVINEIIKHQWEQLGLKTSGVSTTPYYDRAKIYALSDTETDEGYVYKISCKKLKALGINHYRVSNFVTNPSVKEDDEYILVNKNYETIPKDIIVSVSHLYKEK
jgi:hypothetical protein